MTARAGHRDKGYARWWIWLGVAFAVALVVMFILPYLSSPQPAQELQVPPTSITQTDNTNNQSQQFTAVGNTSAANGEQTPSQQL
ncbi:MAG: hypothetical protein ACJ70R_03900 [Nitrososphaera sp.]